MNRFAVMTLAVFAVSAAAAQQGGREAFLKQQSYAEMQRVAGQIDVLQNNLEDISARLSRLERGNRGGEAEALKARVVALERMVSELRQELRNQRGEIVQDLSRKVVQITKANTPPPAPAPRPKVIPAHKEYVVEPGDTLSVIAQACGTSVRKIRELNALKSDALRPGQKIKVPVE